jgi:hypothetical protein
MSQSEKDRYKTQTTQGTKDVKSGLLLSCQAANKNESLCFEMGTSFRWLLDRPTAVKN